MESEKTSSSRPKRKPLSDCTNTLPNRRKNPSSNIPKSQTLIKPLKPSHVTADSIKNKQLPPICSTPKTPASTGSNNLPGFQNVFSILQSPEPPLPLTPVSDAGGVDSRKPRLPNEKRQRTATRKDKGKMIADTPNIELSTSLTSNPLQILSSSAPCHSSQSNTQALASPSGNAQTIKISEKSPGDASVTQFSTPFSSRYSLSETSAADCLKLPEEKRKDKGKMVLENSDIDASEPLTPHSSHASLAASGGIDSRKPTLPDEPSLRNATRKDKGKMIADASIIELSASLISNPPQISSSSAPGYSSESNNQALESPNVHAQTIKDIGKSLGDSSVLQISTPFSSRYKLSSSTFDALPQTFTADYQKLHEEKRQDKGKMVVETFDINASEPSTPHVFHASLAVSGTRERPVTVYNQRRGRPGRKHVDGMFNVSMSYHPVKTKKKGSGLAYEGDINQSGSRSDPLPRCNKKQSRKKDDGSVHEMPKEEVEKLRSYYADIDAFELQEEEVSDNEREEK
ncbi:uncharacterized protein LOC130803128 isoform X2 [Amaranthus tricolor]|uniref:uncharacterized protein LOC130803128 isoform X2 n=1 Tax=Amaranthus tricolor TaxID=29722 RepID=UPI0025884192|nr:uncharacterized protein LOC130803128 isoform X2 [Amaranthus tricolor]